MQPERILLTWYRPFELGGVETFMLNLLRAAHARGDEVAVAATYGADGPLRQAFEREGARILDWTSFAGGPAKGGPSAQAREQVAADTAQWQPSLVLLNDCNDFSVAAAPFLQRLRAYATIIDTFHIDSPDPGYLDFRRQFAHTLDGAAGTNRAILKRFAAHAPGFANVATQYIPNGVPPCGTPRKHPDGKLRLLYLGRMAQDQKRILRLPALFEGLRARNVSFEATLCGEGPQRAELEAALQAAGLDGMVRVIGYRSPAEVQELLLSHDVLVNVSAFEGFSMSVLEALAAGCVPACTDVASLDHEFLLDGVNCLLAPVDRPEALIERLAGLSAETITRMSEQARLASKRLTADACYAGYLSFAARLRQARPIQPWDEAARNDIRRPWELAALAGRESIGARWRRKLQSIGRKVFAS